METGTSLFGDRANWIPRLREAIEHNGLEGGPLTVALPVQADRIDIPDRTQIVLTCGDKSAMWSVSSLRELFRGNKTPPDLSKFPSDHVPFFYFIEQHVLSADSLTQRLRDREMEEIFSNLRRRPDGKHLGPEHAFLWQVFALLLGLHPLSQLEYEAIAGRLAQSCGHFAIGATSRNYFDYLRKGFA